VPGPSRERAGRIAALAVRLRDLAGRPAMVLDMGSGPEAAARVPRGVPIVLVVPRDAPGACAASAARAALPEGADVTLVVNEGARRPDLAARAVGRALPAARALVLPRADREALRLATGGGPGGRRARLLPTLSALAGRLDAGHPGAAA
jgi:hypothetical protein